MPSAKGPSRPNPFRVFASRNSSSGWTTANTSVAPNCTGAGLGTCHSEPLNGVTAFRPANTCPENKSVLCGDYLDQYVATPGEVQNAVVKDVAHALGNTPAVCRKAYIDPLVFAGWRDGRVQRAAASARGERQWEAAALRFLRRAHREAARPARA